MATVRQIEILDIIKKYVKENKIAPTVREICHLSGLKSTSTVHGYITRLEKQGYIKKKDNSPRSIMLCETHCEGIKVTDSASDITIENEAEVEAAESENIIEAADA